VRGICGHTAWFQGTKFMQVNFRDSKVDWVGRRHGTGWLYRVPALALWLYCNSGFYGAYHDTEAQLRGEIVKPDLK
jgi:hypothetical protein